MTKLTDKEITYLIHQVKGDWKYPKETVGQMAARWGVTKRRLRQLLQLWRTTGVVPRLNPNRRPPDPPLTAAQKLLVEREWQRRRKGPTELWRALQSRGIKLSHQKVYQYAKSMGWSRPNPRKQKKRSRCRYEREHSGSLVHGDYHRTSDKHPYVILWEDDASRKILAGGEFPESSSQHAIDTLREAIAHAATWGLTIKEVNTDRGCEFFISPKSRHELAEGQFQEFLREQGIRHVVSRVNNPQTNGKLERFWLEYDKHRWRFATLKEFIEWANDEIHTALWLEMFETPKMAFQRKLPPEVLLGLHMRQVEALA
jgi:transposase InsO family protein